jgi:hypothetical protein
MSKQLRFICASDNKNEVSPPDMLFVQQGVGLMPDEDSNLIFLTVDSLNCNTVLSVGLDRLQAAELAHTLMRFSVDQTRKLAKKDD